MKQFSLVERSLEVPILGMWVEMSAMLGFHLIVINLGNLYKIF